MHWVVRGAANTVHFGYEVQSFVSQRPWSMAHLTLGEHQAYGFARCDDKDSFSEEIGRARAFTRAELELIYLLLEDLYPCVKKQEHVYCYSADLLDAVEQTFGKWLPPEPSTKRGMDIFTHSFSKGIADLKHSFQRLSLAIQGEE